MPEDVLMIDGYPLVPTMKKQLVFKQLSRRNDARRADGVRFSMISPAGEQLPH